MQSTMQESPSSMTNSTLSNKRLTGLALALALTSAAPVALASPSISGGFWMNYRYHVNSGTDEARDSNTSGDIADEAIVFYITDKPKDKPWSFESEIRFGPGAFTNPANNSTGDNFGIHKAWMGYQLNDTHAVKIGKSQVPFGFKNSNFWPGDMLMGGYGDQMDVGVKLSGSQDTLSYNLAYYHADDWGETSTDTMDDGGHWGTKTTYRKVQTVVADASFPLAENHTIGASYQNGQLQDLEGTDPENPLSGSHNAAVAYYKGKVADVGIKAQYLATERRLPKPLNQEFVQNTRALLELSYSMGDYYFYADGTWASPDTEGNTADDVAAYAYGMMYDYGAGWFYVEYLTQNGYINANGMVGEGDFDALYVTLDYYF